MSSKHRGYPRDEDIDDPDDEWIKHHVKLQSRDVWRDTPIVNEDEEDQKQKDLEDEGGPSWDRIISEDEDEDEDEDDDKDEVSKESEEEKEEKEEVEKKEAEEKEKEEKLSKKFSKMRATK